MGGDTLNDTHYTSLGLILDDTPLAFIKLTNNRN